MEAADAAIPALTVVALVLRRAGDIGRGLGVGKLQCSAG
jgi:hypothetical protein